MNAQQLKDKAAIWLGDDRKKVNLIILLAAAAVLMIMLSDNSCTPDSDAAIQNTAAVSSEEYARQLEIKLEDMVSSIDGAGQARVMVTLQNGTEYVYASEDAFVTDSSESTDPAGRQSTDERQDRKSSYIIIDTGNGEEALVRTELMPTVSGVVVICQGADDPLVAERIMAVVTVALDISPKRVCITQLSQ